MSTPAPACAWAARTAGLASTSGRHAVPMAATTGGSRRRLRSSSAGSAVPRAHALGYDGRPVPSPPSPRAFGSPPPSGYVSRPGLGMQPSQQRPPQVPPQRLTPSQQQPPVEQLAAAAAAAQQQQQQEEQEAAALGSSGSDQPTEHEVRRRQKISAANKGRTPWNKGRKHPPEVIARIRAATQLAMQRPDVKQRLAKANEKREPHTDAAKEKIRVKLLERASAAREEINIQAEIILRERLAGSDNPEWRQLAEYPKALDVVAGLAWQFFKKDWTEVAGRGWEEHPEFRERCIWKLRKLIDRSRTSGSPKKRKMDKVKAALGNMKKLEEARVKLGSAEDAVAKLRRAKVAFAGDAAKLGAVQAAEEKATKLLTKLRQQVAKLEDALQPLQEYLEEQQSLAAAGAAAGPPPGQQHLELELRLEAAAAQQRERVQQLAAAGGVPADGVAAPAHGGQATTPAGYPNGSLPDAAINGSSSSNGSSKGSSNGNGSLFNGSLNGSNGAVPGPAAYNGSESEYASAQVGVNGQSPAAAAPGRTALPWQR